MVQSAKVLLFLLLLCSPSFLHGQSEAELELFLRMLELKSAAPEQELKAASVKLEQAREINDARETALALKQLGFVQLNLLHDYEKAMDSFVTALTIEDSLHLESQRALTYVAIARIFSVVGDNHKSAQLLNQALTINKDQRSINSLALILISLGVVNTSLGQLEDALANYQEVLQHREDISKPFEAEALFRLAKLYTVKGQHDRALNLHKEALAVIRSANDRTSEALYLNEIGILYGFMGNEKRSLANHEAALEIRTSINDRAGMAESLNNLASLHLRSSNLGQAIASANHALELGQEAQAREHMFRSYELLSQAHKETGDFQNSLRYKELSSAILEFIQNENQEQQLLETQTRYVLGKKEGEIERLDALTLQREQELDAQKRFRNFLFVLVGLVFVIALLVLYLYLVKRRSNRILQAAKIQVQRHNEQLQALNNTKDKFFSIISHDLKGPLNSLTSFSHLLIEHTDSLSREEIRMLARDLDMSVKNLFALLENLLEWSRSQTGNIDFSPEEFDLTTILHANKDLLQSQAATKRISIETDAPGECWVRLHKHSITTVLRNLMSNAIKFTPEGGAIRAGIRTDEKAITVYVSDNGVGMSQEVISKLFRIDAKHSTKGTANEKGTGLGLVLCREFVEKNGGKIAVTSAPGKGAVFSLSFPASVRARPSTHLVGTSPFS